MTLARVSFTGFPFKCMSLDISLDNGGGIDGFDFNLDDLDDGDFDLDATNI